MYTRILLVRNCLVAEDANGVLLGLDLEVVLADARQFYNRNEVVALLEDVDRRITANTRGTVAHPVAVKPRVERPLKRKQRVEWICVVGYQKPPQVPEEMVSPDVTSGLPKTTGLIPI